MTDDQKFVLTGIFHEIARALNNGDFADCPHDTRLMLRTRIIQAQEVVDADDAAPREATTKAAVVRDLAIERAPNVQRLSARFGGMAFLVHAVGDRT